MMLLNRIFARACFALFFATLILHSAEIELLPGAAVRIQTGSQSERVAVDVSRDLLSWRAMTNVVAAAGQITLVNNPDQTDPARFFRVSDADDTFAISGYVDAGQYFGGIAGATIRESLTGTTAQSDANGFFHFNQRFARADLPITITAYSEDRVPVERIISATDANTFSVFRMQMAEPNSLSGLEENQTYYFKVTGGPRAGIEYSIHFNSGWATATGAVSGQGLFQHVTVDSAVHYSLTFGQKASEIVFGPYLSRGDDRVGYFAGIPSTNGTLSGNGIVTWHLTNFGPASLDGMAFQIGNDQIQFTNGLYRLVVNSLVEQGSYAAFRNRSTWSVFLTLPGQTIYNHALSLNFSSLTNGTFELKSASDPWITGEMHEIPYVPGDYNPGGAPITVPNSIRFVVGPGAGIGEGTRITVAFNGGVFMAIDDQGNSMGSGTFTYTPDATKAHLRMDYPMFGTDFDDIMLEFKAPPGSTVPSIFYGTQLVSGTMYPYNGTFTY